MSDKELLDNAIEALSALSDLSDKSILKGNKVIEALSVDLAALSADVGKPPPQVVAPKGISSGERFSG